MLAPGPRGGRVDVPVPPFRNRAGGPLRLRLVLVVLAIGAIASAAYAFAQLGPFLTKEDPLAPADAVFVLAGTRMIRPLEAADLYLEGYAPHLVMTRDMQEERAFNDIAGRGHPFQPDAERARDVFVSMGIPRDAILIPDRFHDSTAEEAITLRELAAKQRWRRVIVVTSRYHLRRAAFAVRRELRGSDVTVTMRASRYDPTTADQWWTRRAEIRWVASEVPKLVAYALGLGA